jgi:hypothetical protein
MESECTIVGSAAIFQRRVQTVVLGRVIDRDSERWMWCCAGGVWLVAMPAERCAEDDNPTQVANPAY